jgi:eukaryotic-like serine/threonine-protein kinase
VVRTDDVDEVEGGVQFIVLERLVGKTLRDELREKTRLPVTRTANIMIQVVAAVRAIHSARIIHRDLKPSNIFLVSTPNGDDLAKVLDFGIAKSLDGDSGLPGDEDLTGTGIGIGSFGYMSPEQAYGGFKYVGFAADVWSLGVILYECLVGRVPWARSPAGGHASRDPEAYLRATRDIRPFLRALPPEVPASLQEVVAEALEGEAGKRISLVQMFEGLRAHATIAPPPVPPPAMEVDVPERSGPSTGDTTRTHTDEPPHADEPWRAGIPPQAGAPKPPRSDSPVAAYTILGIAMAAAGVLAFVGGEGNEPATGAAAMARPGAFVVDGTGGDGQTATGTSLDPSSWTAAGDVDRPAPSAAATGTSSGGRRTASAAPLQKNPAELPAVSAVALHSSPSTTDEPRVLPAAGGPSAAPLPITVEPHEQSPGRSTLPPTKPTR